MVPKSQYSTEDLNWNNTQSRIVQEYEDESKRTTELAQATPDNFAQYRTILLGYPVGSGGRWGRLVRLRSHFLQEPWHQHRCRRQLWWSRQHGERRGERLPARGGEDDRPWLRGG